MTKIDKSWQKNGFLIRRLAKKEDAENYYNQNYNPLDKEVARLTGCKEVFTKEEVFSFFETSIQDDNYYLFLVLEPDGQIMGEAVINEMDFKLRCANFRIALFHSSKRGKGIGTWVVETIRDFAFEELKLHRLELNVFSYNPRAERIYLKTGFKREGILRDTVLDGNTYADDILMSILEDEWRQIKGLKS